MPSITKWNARLRSERDFVQDSPFLWKHHLLRSCQIRLYLVNVWVPMPRSKLFCEFRIRAGFQAAQGPSTGRQSPWISAWPTGWPCGPRTELICSTF